MVTKKTKEEIELLKEAGTRQAAYLKELLPHIRPGVSAEFLDSFIFTLIKNGGDSSAFLNYRPGGSAKPYPATLCVSRNNEVVHSPPAKSKILEEGDVVSIDIGLSHKGMIVDSAITVALGAVDAEAKKLIAVTSDCLTKAIHVARVGNHIGDISSVIEETAKGAGFSLAEDLAGHGVGYSVHEDPYVPNVGKKGTGILLEEGMVLAIEPILCAGSGKIVLDRKDGFTYKTKDGKRAAHFEHTIVITKEGPLVVTAL